MREDVVDWEGSFRTPLQGPSSPLRKTGAPLMRLAAGGRTTDGSHTSG